LVDFPAPLLWDIRDTDATANVETSGGWLFGDPGPSSAAARDSRGIDNIMGEYVTHRPLVHVFLIQETMDVDCHEMVSFGGQTTYQQCHFDEFYRFLYVFICPCVRRLWRRYAQPARTCTPI